MSSTVHITMVKKRQADGAECRKCLEATDYLQQRGLWNRIDELVWAQEGDPQSPGMVMGAEFGVDRAPFFIVRDGQREWIYSSVLQLVREHLGEAVSTREQAAAIDADDIGGI